MRSSFVTISPEGLDRDSLPMRLYEKAKRLGVWNPAAVDFSRDHEDWAVLEEEKREAIIQLTTLFQAGEEGVTLDLLPLMMVIAGEGRIEEELFLTTFLFEEGKHTDFFRRFLDEVAKVDYDLSGHLTPTYRTLFYEELPTALGRLKKDPSPKAQVLASVTYNMVIEGVLAETGYHSYFLSLERNDLMPGLRSGLAHIKRDESRHIAYGVHLLSRLICDHPELWETAETRMNELLELSTTFIAETFEPYPDNVTPFGITLDEILEFSTGQFMKRLDRIRRGAAVEEVEEALT